MNKKNLDDGKIENAENKIGLSIIEACENILWGSSLDCKTSIQENVSWNIQDLCSYTKLIPLEKAPGRPSNLLFSEKKIQFPKDHEFSHQVSRAKALHFFANHELLAIEVMAKMILVLPFDEKFLEVKKDIWKTLKDEQKHLVLYTKRLHELGYDFGDFPVNDYFWKIFSDVKNYTSYFSTMALTFESANLDFAAFYAKLFSHVGDFASSELMMQVFRDEIHHVKLGYNFLNDHYSCTQIWSHYVDSLPWPITPARAKGIHYREEHRRASGMSLEFIRSLSSYKDGFNVTERKR